MENFIFCAVMHAWMFIMKMLIEMENSFVVTVSKYKIYTENVNVN